MRSLALTSALTSFVLIGLPVPSVSSTTVVTEGTRTSRRHESQHLRIAQFSGGSSFKFKQKKCFAPPCTPGNVVIPRQGSESGNLYGTLSQKEKNITIKIRNRAASTATADVIRTNLENDDPEGLLTDYVKDQVYYKEGELIYNCAGSKDTLGCARHMQAYAEDTIKSDWRFQSGRLVYKCQPYKSNGKVKSTEDLLNDCDDGISGLVDSVMSSYEVRTAVLAQKYGDKYSAASAGYEIVYKCTGNKNPEKCAAGVFEQRFEGIHGDARKLDSLRLKAQDEALQGVGSVNKELYKAAKKAGHTITKGAKDAVNEAANQGKKAGREIKKILKW